MQKADYNKIADSYDTGRYLSEENTVMWLERIRKLSGAGEGARVLDLGCGTGRFALPLAGRAGFKVTGADSSAAMLEKARQKDTNKIVTWVHTDAGALCFAAGSFDLVFMSHLLHHVESPLQVLKECNRVLSTSGKILIRYGAMEQIRDDVEHRFFPQVTAIDEPRTPTRRLTEDWLAGAGFTGIRSEEIAQQTYASGEAHLAAARVKSTSVLSMITEESFRTGSERLAEYVSRNPGDAWLLFDKMTLTVGEK